MTQSKKDDPRQLLYQSLSWHISMARDKKTDEVNIRLYQLTGRGGYATIEEALRKLPDAFALMCQHDREMKFNGVSDDDG